ncbi:hypothetical protein [Kitasatospora purpeofusca]|uniref:Uncharacterized protein n=1 Tax=Kitasatospora purpeofusca TaxID=67352 RepID=A0ABZ1UBY6_9ACTN|nr:hypothetical protein [Kitasatospora purpeofusca]
MYLVHAALRPVSQGRRLPRDARELLLATARPEEGIEHLVVHPDAVPDPVIGIYLLARSLAEAEERGAAFCRRALAAVPELEHWRPARVAAPLVAPFYEQLLTCPAGPDGPGRNGPGTLSSS